MTERIDAGPSGSTSTSASLSRTDAHSNRAATTGVPGPSGQAPVPPARLHDAGHPAATLRMQQGVPSQVVMYVLGHSPSSLTLGTYSRVVPELDEDAARRMGEALWGLSDHQAGNAQCLAPVPRRRECGSARRAHTIEPTTAITIRGSPSIRRPRPLSAADLHLHQSIAVFDAHRSPRFTPHFREKNGGKPGAFGTSAAGASLDLS